jgi:hypothetical protein
MEQILSFVGISDTWNLLVSHGVKASVFAALKLRSRLCLRGQTTVAAETVANILSEHSSAAVSLVFSKLVLPVELRSNGPIFSPVELELTGVINDTYCTNWTKLTNVQRLYTDSPEFVLDNISSLSRLSYLCVDPIDNLWMDRDANGFVQALAKHCPNLKTLLTWETPSFSDAKGFRERFMRKLCLSAVALKALLEGCEKLQRLGIVELTSAHLKVLQTTPTQADLIIYVDSGIALADAEEGATGPLYRMPALDAFIDIPGMFAGKMELVVIDGDGGYLGGYDEELARDARHDEMFLEMEEKAAFGFEGRWSIQNFN